MKKDLVLAGLMHDLNNVLQAIGQAADILSTDPEWAELAESIIASVDRGKAIVQSASEVSSHVDLLAVAKRALSASRLQCEIEIEPGIGFAGKPLAIERVLANLVVNSEQAGATEFRLAASLASGSPDIVILASDNGPGIPEGLLPRIFRACVSGGAKSTGLGLHIVETIVREHGGAIHAENGDGEPRGARFTIRIPAGNP
jgi:signal transduction histidine kinase